MIKENRIKKIKFEFSLVIEDKPSRMPFKKLLIHLLFFRKKTNINETKIIKRLIRVMLSFIKYNMFVLKKDSTITWY